MRSNIILLLRKTIFGPNVGQFSGLQKSERNLLMLVRQSLFKSVLCSKFHPNTKELKIVLNARKTRLRTLQYKMIGLQPLLFLVKQTKVAFPINNINGSGSAHFFRVTAGHSHNLKSKFFTVQYS